MPPLIAILVVSHKEEVRHLLGIPAHAKGPYLSTLEEWRTSM